jgi:hypothetical protein
MADLDKLEELAKVATRVAAYLDRRSRSSGLDKEEIHAFDVGPDGEGFYLRSSDLRALASQALARRDGVEEPVGDVIEGVQNAIKGLRAHVAAIQADKRAGTNAGSIYNCINDLPNIIRQLEAAEFEIEAEFERYEDAHPAPTAHGDGAADDMEWPESPLANALFDHVQSQFSLDRDEAAEEAGEILQILADHGVDPTKLPAALRQPDTAAVTADAVRNTITRFLNADDPTHWGEFEKRLAVAVGMTPSTAEDASMAAEAEKRGYKRGWNDQRDFPKLRTAAPFTAEDASMAGGAEERKLSDSVSPLTAELHPDTAMLVNSFAISLAHKLLRAEQKYGYSNGWLKDDWEAKCRSDLLEHVHKGDPLDVAAYAAFCWARGWSTTPADPRPDPREALREARFLEARLSEFENEDLSEEAARAWMGHVHPSLSRLRQALATINAVMGEAG